MIEFSGLTVPFRWEPEALEADDWISEVNLWIDAYPTFYSVYDDGRYKPGMQFYWVQNDFVVCPHIWLNYYKSTVYPPLGARPTGILVTSPKYVKLRGEAVIATPQSSDDVEVVASRIEDLTIKIQDLAEAIALSTQRIEAKIDALP